MFAWRSDTQHMSNSKKELFSPHINICQILSAVEPQISINLTKSDGNCTELNIQYVTHLETYDYPTINPLENRHDSMRD